MSAEVLEERVAIVRRVRECLLKQRENLRSYLNVLEGQQRAAEAGNMESFEVHVELEQSIIRDITTLQKVIIPLEELYSISCTPSDDAVAELKDSVERLRRRALEKNEENRMLLKGYMEAIRNEITSLRVNIRARSPYSDIGVPSLVDIRT